MIYKSGNVCALIARCLFEKHLRSSISPKSSELFASMANNPSPSEKRTMIEEERFPELFVHTNIDRRICQRVVPLKVIVVGMPRTGTQCI